MFYIKITKYGGTDKRLIADMINHWAETDTITVMTTRKERKPERETIEFFRVYKKRDK